MINDLPHEDPLYVMTSSPASLVSLVLFSLRLKADEGPRRERKDADRGRQRDGRGRGRGRPEVIQSHSIFEQGPAEMMAKRRGKDCVQKLLPLLPSSASLPPSPLLPTEESRREE